MRVAASTIALILLLAGAACGGEDSEKNGDAAQRRTQESKPRGEGRRSRRAIEPSAQAASERMLLTLSDVPESWRGSPSEGDDEEDEEAFRRCVDTDYSAFTIIGEGESELSEGDSTSALWTLRRCFRSDNF